MKPVGIPEYLNHIKDFYHPEKITELDPVTLSNCVVYTATTFYMMNQFLLSLYSKTGDLKTREEIEVFMKELATYDAEGTS